MSKEMGVVVFRENSGNASVEYHRTGSKEATESWFNEIQDGSWDTEEEGRITRAYKVTVEEIWLIRMRTSDSS